MFFHTYKFIIVHVSLLQRAYLSSITKQMKKDPPDSTGTRQKSAAKGTFQIDPLRHMTFELSHQHFASIYYLHHDMKPKNFMQH